MQHKIQEFCKKLCKFKNCDKNVIWGAAEKPLPLSICGRKMRVSGPKGPEMPFYSKLMSRMKAEPYFRFHSQGCVAALLFFVCVIFPRPEAPGGDADILFKPLIEGGRIGIADFLDDIPITSTRKSIIIP